MPLREPTRRRPLRTSRRREGPSSREPILIAAPAMFGGFGENMGAKYLPTIKDLKAAQRFREKQALLNKAKKAARAHPAKEPDKK